MPGSRSSRPYYDYSTAGDKRRARDLARRNSGMAGGDEDFFREYFGRNYSGKMSDDLSSIFDALYGGTGAFQSGGVGGIDRQMSGGVMNEYGEFSGGGMSQDSPHGNQWFGPKDPAYDQFGNVINFRRDVSPYMMYNHPEDPNMWDELPNPATPSRGEAGMPGEHMADPWGEKYSREYWNDRAEDLAEIASKEMRRSGSRGLANILGKQRNRLDALRRRIARRG